MRMEGLLARPEEMGKAVTPNPGTTKGHEKMMNGVRDTFDNFNHFFLPRQRRRI